MKRHLICALAAALFLPFAASAQEDGSASGTEYYVSAGMTLPGQETIVDGKSDVTDAGTGFNLGVGYRMGMGNTGAFGIAANIFFNYNNIQDDTAGATSTLTETFIGLGFMLNYRIDLNGGQFAILPYAGPIMKAGLSSKAKTKVGGTETEVNLYDDKESPYLNQYSRFSYAIGIGVAFDIGRHVRLNLGYDLAMGHRYYATKPVDVEVNDCNSLNFGVAWKF